MKQVEGMDDIKKSTKKFKVITLSLLGLYWIYFIFKPSLLSLMVGLFLILIGLYVFVTLEFLELRLGRELRLAEHKIVLMDEALEDCIESSKPNKTLHDTPMYGRDLTFRINKGDDM